MTVLVLVVIVLFVILLWFVFRPVPGGEHRGNLEPLAASLIASRFQTRPRSEPSAG